MTAKEKEAIRSMAFMIEELVIRVSDLDPGVAETLHSQLKEMFDLLREPFDIVT